MVDAHSAAFMGPWWNLPPTWLKKLLARKAITTLVTNDYLQQIVFDLGGDSLVLKDIPTTFDANGQYPLAGEFNVALINTFSADEPLAEVIQAAATLPDVQFYVTGKLNGKSSDLIKDTPKNVHFTDFLPNKTFYNLLNNVQAVMCLTTRNHTMQRGACEALSMGKPIITSDWPILRQYFNKGTVHVDNSVDGIQQGVLQMQANLSDFQKGIKALQLDQQYEWQAKMALLVSRINEYMTRQKER